MRVLKSVFQLILKREASSYQNSVCSKDIHFKVHPSVSQALVQNKPVVALESTIITHGMPYPHNLSTAKEVEAIVRAEGATPATIGIIEGEIRIGLTSDELDHLARSKSPVKVSRWDLPYVISKVREPFFYLNQQSQTLKYLKPFSYFKLMFHERSGNGKKKQIRRFYRVYVLCLFYSDT